MTNLRNPPNANPFKLTDAISFIHPDDAMPPTQSTIREGEILTDEQRKAIKIELVMRERSLRELVDRAGLAYSTASKIMAQDYETPARYARFFQHLLEGE